MVRVPILGVAAILLAAGCCCPAVSGRYCEVGLPAPQSAATAGGAIKSSHCDPEKRGHLAGRHAGLHRLPILRGREEGGPVPSQQQFDYVGPLPKFHPAPTRPVFEPQDFYEPPLEAAPRRPSAPGGTH